jgi:hypothetical protein
VPLPRHGESPSCVFKDPWECLKIPKHTVTRGLSVAISSQGRQFYSPEFSKAACTSLGTPAIRDLTTQLNIGGECLLRGLMIANCVLKRLRPPAPSQMDKNTNRDLPRRCPACPMLRKVNRGLRSFEQRAHTRPSDKDSQEREARPSQAARQKDALDVVDEVLHPMHGKGQYLLIASTYQQI